MAETKKKTVKNKPTVKKVAKPVKVETKQEITTRYGARGRVFTGTVLKASMQRTVKVGWPRQKYLPKYERFEKRRTRVMVHVPEGVNVKVGDKVTICECRPISKTKHFVVLEVLDESN